MAKAAKHATGHAMPIPRSGWSMVRLGASVLAALIFGFFAITFVFSDLGPDESMTGRVAMDVILHLAVGAAFGFLNPAYWWLSSLAGWGTALFGLLGFLGTFNPLALSMLLIAGAALLGGYLGVWVKRMR